MVDYTIPSERPAIRVQVTASPNGANITNVALRFTRMDGRPTPHNFDLWLSDAVTGAGDTAVTASGAVAAGAAGFIVFAYTAKKHFRAQTNSSGLFNLSITDTAKTAFFVCVEVEGRTYVMIPLVTASYG